MPLNRKYPSLELDVSADHRPRIRLLLREGIIAVQLLVIASWLAVHLVLDERIATLGAWGPLLMMMALFIIQTRTNSDNVWRYSGLLFMLTVVLGFKLIFLDYPPLHRQFSLAMTVLAVVGASLLIRGPMDYLLVAVLSWVLVMPHIGHDEVSDYRWYLAIFFAFSISLGWINSRTYLRALSITLQIEQHYRTLSETDYLTSLYNRRALMDRFERVIESHGGGFFMMIDIDDFKRINDQLGHAAGDQVLRVLAARLRNMAGSHCAGRLGGEEFGVIIDTLSPAIALAIAQRLLEAVRNSREAPARFTFSAGLVPFSHDQALADILIHADRCLYKAKRAGKDRVHFGVGEHLS
ncbi:GGDEF domain-containing protein [Pseudomonas plecoglossicida]|uniref:GGDEF domain-containing protein n=1 Tax=Pseudomonas plecoglossicida TaxID=70775 RepID=UPI0015E29142|nr:GGDEF domain-containing protein [Pseudomonas plecoglossicida]MBA1197671.1 GGDEF domain-containing protein [Pseudomonas plecoglossicida]